jgi:hypothetical protein
MDEVMRAPKHEQASISMNQFQATHVWECLPSTQSKKTPRDIFLFPIHGPSETLNVVKINRTSYCDKRSYYYGSERSYHVGPFSLNGLVSRHCYIIMFMPIEFKCLLRRQHRVPSSPFLERPNSLTLLHHITSTLASLVAATAATSAV